MQMLDTEAWVTSPGWQYFVDLKQTNNPKYHLLNIYSFPSTVPVYCSDKSCQYPLRSRPVGCLQRLWGPLLWKWQGLQLLLGLLSSLGTKAASVLYRAGQWGSRWHPSCGWCCMDYDSLWPSSLFPAFFRCFSQAGLPSDPLCAIILPFFFSTAAVAS